MMEANWSVLLKHFGSEKEARKYLASQLRDFANMVDEGYPYVCECRALPPETKFTCMGTISVTLTVPWGG